MKKTVIFLLTFLLFFLTFHSQIFAKETTPMKFFGVGATVEPTDLGAYKVITEGNKAEEGFVYTPTVPFSSTQIKYSVALRGNGKFQLKIVETDARGQSIKEKTLPVTLTDDWKTFELPFTLESKTSQIDVFVLTTSKSKTEFSFKDLEVVNEQ